MAFRDLKIEQQQKHTKTDIIIGIYRNIFTVYKNEAYL